MWGPTAYRFRPDRYAANTELPLVESETGADVTDRDGVGELWVRGPQVMAGYHNDPGATAEALTTDGWLRTGASSSTG